MHGGGSAPSCCAFIQRDAFEEVYGPSCRDQEGRRGSDEVVLGTSGFPSSETGMSGNTFPPTVSEALREGLCGWGLQRERERQEFSPVETSHRVKEGLVCHGYVEARDVAKNPIIHRTAPHLPQQRIIQSQMSIVLRWIRDMV